MYDGNLDPMNEVNEYLEGNVKQGNLPTTPQDEAPHNDGLFGRNYDGFDQSQVGRNGTDVLNTFDDGDHMDVIEQDQGTGTMYHNRIQK